MDEFDEFDEDEETPTEIQQRKLQEIHDELKKITHIVGDEMAVGFAFLMILLLAILWRVWAHS